MEKKLCINNTKENKNKKYYENITKRMATQKLIHANRKFASKFVNNNLLKATYRQECIAFNQL